jgi:hypothetical protein
MRRGRGRSNKIEKCLVGGRWRSFERRRFIPDERLQPLLFFFFVVTEASLDQARLLIHRLYP